MWARVFLRLALILLGLGYGPLLVTQYVLTGVDQLVPVLLAFSVGPLGVLALIAAAILFLAALVRQRPGSS